MNRAIAGLASVVLVALVGLKLAVHLGYLGQPDREQLGAESIQAMEDYCKLVAEVRTPQDIKAVEKQEAILRWKALDTGGRYVKEVLKDRAGKKETMERFNELTDRFQAECKRYDRLCAQPQPDDRKH
ncbi:MAG: hypothetical protein ACJ8FY_09325 [Gemmataceae bacterium]